MSKSKSKFTIEGENRVRRAIRGSLTARDQGNEDKSRREMDEAQRLARDPNLRQR